MTFFMARKLNVADKHTYEVEIKEFISEPYIKTQMPEQSSQDNTLPIMQRRRAVWELIGMIQEFRNTDETRLAQLVEAVVGGNITVKAKDTSSYKQCTKSARNGDDKLIAGLMNPRKTTPKR